MSEAENPELLTRSREITPEDIRALAGAVTPHFALQIRNRIRRLIEPLPPEHPARLEGERKIAQPRRARQAQRRAARDARDRALKYLAPGVWRLKELPATRASTSTWPRTS